MKTVWVMIGKELRESWWAPAAAFVLIFAGGWLTGFRGGRDGVWYPEFLGMTVLFGPPLALIAGVSVSCRDLGGPVETFWRSRPISVGALWLIKYTLPLAGLMAAMLAADAVTVMTAAPRFGGGTLVVSGIVGSPVVGALLAVPGIYTVAFVAGSLVRRAAVAGILALGVILLLAYLPLLIPQMGPLSLFTLVQDKPIRVTTVEPGGIFGVVWGFEPRVGWAALSMLATCVVGWAVAVAAVRRGWVLRVDQRLIGWAMGGTALLMWGATAAQVGSNIEAVDAVMVGEQYPGGVLQQIAAEGDRAVLAWTWGEERTLSLQRVDAHEDRLRLHDAVSTDIAGVDNSQWQAHFILMPEHPDLVLGLINERTPGALTPLSTVFKLVVVDVAAAPRAARRVSELVLWNRDPALNLQAAVLRDRKLYVARAGRQWVIDVGDVRRPTVLVDREDAAGPSPGWLGSWSAWDKGNGLRTLRLSRWPGADDATRIAASVGVEPYGLYLRGDTLMRAVNSGVDLFRLASVSGNSASFVFGGHVDRSPFALATAGDSGQGFVTERLGGWMDTMLHWSLVVCDISDPAHPRRIGQFSSPSAHRPLIQGLDGDRVLVAGRERVELLAPLKGR